MYPDNGKFENEKFADGIHHEIYKFVLLENYRAYIKDKLGPTKKWADHQDVLIF